MTTKPLCSVVLCTFNRAALVTRAVSAVLDQGVDDLELIVVDDGSTDDTPDVLASIVDHRLRVRRRPNGGLSAARNTGIAAATGRWLVFLDDDDVPKPGWLAALTAHDADPRCAAASCGGELVDAAGEHIGEARPRRLGPPFGEITAQFLPGTFSVRRDVLTEAGGYLEGLGFSHQYELFLRIARVADRRGMQIRSDDRLLLTIFRRPATDRPIVNPPMLFDGNRWVLARHSVSFATAARARADFEAVVGVNAARLGRWAEARRYFARSARSDPTRPRRWARVAAAAFPIASRRVWGDDVEFATHDTAARGIKLQRRAPSDEGPAARELFLPWGYVENENRSADRGGTPFWDEGMAASDDRSQVPVYRLAARLVARRAWSPVVDVGCGTGHKLVRCIGGATDDIVGMDQDSAIDLAEAAFPDRRWLRGDLGDDALWKEVGAREPALTICADVVEHVDDPVDLLSRLRELAQPNGRVLLSTPDRAVFDGASVLGPPTNPKHIREWTRSEFDLLLESVGFTTERMWHLLPRSYSFRRTELQPHALPGCAPPCRPGSAIMHVLPGPAVVMTSDA